MYYIVFWIAHNSNLRLGRTPLFSKWLGVFAVFYTLVSHAIVLILLCNKFLLKSNSKSVDINPTVFMLCSAIVLTGTYLFFDNNRIDAIQRKLYNKHGHARFRGVMIIFLPLIVAIVCSIIF
jgi:hypothetical protein